VAVVVSQEQVVGKVVVGVIVESSFTMGLGLEHRFRWAVGD
jgi:hypothetical protein